MIHLFWLMISLTWRDRYPKKIFFITDMLSSMLDVIFYYFTSEAFGRAFLSHNYFQYVIWGEIVIAIPMALFLSSTKALRSSLIEGTWEILLMNPSPIYKILFRLQWGEYFREGCRLCLMVGLASILGAQFHFQDVLKAMILIILSSPLFWNLGLLSVSLFVYTGRGLGAVQHLSHFATILAGVYFPLTVFPSWLLYSSLVLSPWTWLIEASRKEIFDYKIAFIFMGASLILGFLGPWVFSKGLKNLAKTGRRLQLIN